MNGAIAWIANIASPTCAPRSLPPERCVGKFYWKGLAVRDMRHLTDPDLIFEVLAEHLRLTTIGGRIRLMITVFAPERDGQPMVRIWNSQLVRYAGYRQPDGSVIGDSAAADFTASVQALGWKGRGTPFDILPIVLQRPAAGIPRPR